VFGCNRETTLDFVAWGSSGGLSGVAIVACDERRAKQQKFKEPRVLMISVGLGTVKITLYL